MSPITPKIKRTETARMLLVLKKRRVIVTSSKTTKGNIEDNISSKSDLRASIFAEDLIFWNVTRAKSKILFKSFAANSG